MFKNQEPTNVGSRQQMFNSEQLEECDDTSGDEMVLYKFDNDSNQFTYKVCLLCNKKITKASEACIVFRPCLVVINFCLLRAPPLV